MKSREKRVEKRKRKIEILNDRRGKKNGVYVEAKKLAEDRARVKKL